MAPLTRGTATDTGAKSPSRIPVRNGSHSPAFSVPPPITSGRMLYWESARIPATRTLLLTDPRQAWAGVRLMDSSPLAWKATRNELPSGQGGALKSAISGWELRVTTGVVLTRDTI